MPGRATTAAVELTFTIFPATPPATIRRANAWQHRKGPFRLVSITASHSSSVISRRGVTGYCPALLIRKWTAAYSL